MQVPMYQGNCYALIRFNIFFFDTMTILRNKILTGLTNSFIKMYILDNKELQKTPFLILGRCQLIWLQFEQFQVLTYSQFDTDFKCTLDVVN